jgi:small multidrug resistance family-3 protein
VLPSRPGAASAAADLLLISAAISLAIYVWLPTFHPTAARRVYASFGAMVVAIALAW